MNRQKPKPQLTSPAGRAFFPSLKTPDTKFDKSGGGKYNVKLVFDPADCEAFVKEIDRLYDENYKQQCEEAGEKKLKKAGKPYRDHLDKDKNPTGEIEFTFAMKAKGTNRDGETFERRPKIFGPDGSLIPTDQIPNIGTGSTLKVNHFIDGWHTQMVGAGVSLRLRAVQIIELVEWTDESDAGEFGFSEAGDALTLPAATPKVEVLSGDADEADF